MIHDGSKRNPDVKLIDRNFKQVEAIFLDDILTDSQKIYLSSTNVELIIWDFFCYPYLCHGHFQICTKIQKKLFSVENLSSSPKHGQFHLV